MANATVDAIGQFFLDPPRLAADGARRADATSMEGFEEG